MTGSMNGGRDRSYQELRDSEELHRATLSSISDAVFTTDDQGAFTYVCPNVDVIFGWTPDEVRGMGRIDRLLGERLFDPGELAARGEIRNLERDVISKTGERRTVLVLLKRVSIQGGTVLYTCRDVTELKRAERELAILRLEIAHAGRLALCGELMASIVHEIQQPLTAILANSGAGRSLAERPADAERLSEMRSIFDDIHDGCAAAAAIIERLRSLARKKALELQPLQVNDVVGDVLLLVASDALRRGVRIDTDLETSLPLVEGDRVSLQQVLLNLIVNAMDAMEGDEARGRRLAVRTCRAGDAVELVVADTGHGIPPGILPMLFEPFFTTKPEGLGLGLAIARSLVEAHAGRLSAEPSREGGATFRVSLPARPDAAA